MTPTKPGIDWAERYVLLEHWKSDLDFYTDDLRFLHHLIDKYFIWITKRENLDMVKELRIQIAQLKEKCNELLEAVKSEMHHIASMMETPEDKKPELSREECEELEKEFTGFVKSFRANRKEVFKITEYIMDSEELPSLLKS
ncbi:hypothetical protein [Poritiphilus flavus]|uniref:Uncharacterized protein n=1 Tax=Poritiphilus flavus TaxID=2697053 RepID=A0A6L9EB39_9FLAO|nr:hypothetical protein [Poritiphilus flavus]NAS11910.1 hypothetical protein [Poritiphilus flavus]